VAKANGEVLVHTSALYIGFNMAIVRDFGAITNPLIKLSHFAEELYTNVRIE
jgi:hypothetical protein